MRFPAAATFVALALTAASPARAGTFTVTNTSNSGPGSLRQAIEDVNASVDPTNDIVFALAPSSTITWASNPPIIRNSVTIDGAGNPSLAISGGNAHRVFFVDADGGTVAIRNLDIIDGRARGGDGGDGSSSPGGGGLGAGGGLFVSRGDVSLSSVDFSNNSAVGGAGGDAVAGDRGGAGGGGGLHGAGGDANFNQNTTSSTISGSGGGGGFYGNGGAATFGGGGSGGGGFAGNGGRATSFTVRPDDLSAGGGGGGLVNDGQDSTADVSFLIEVGGNGSDGALGGQIDFEDGEDATVGGGGGGALFGDGGDGALFGGGGGTGQEGRFGGGDGGRYGGGGGGRGNGGDFGGGGGGSEGGQGGYGGGGGGGLRFGGGSGGFGGGGGAGALLPALGGDAGAFGGDGGASGLGPGAEEEDLTDAGGGGGGGAGLGGAIFVRHDTGATLSLRNVSENSSGVTAGLGGSGFGGGTDGQDGQAVGSGMFLGGGTTTIELATLGLVINGDIAESSPSTLEIIGFGRLFLNGNNSHTGGTILSGVELSISSASALGSGPFVAAGGELLTTGLIDLTQAIDLQADLPIQASSTVTLSGPIDESGGSFGLTLRGASRFVLAGPVSYTGETVIEPGNVLEVQTDATTTSVELAAFTDGRLDINGGRINAFVDETFNVLAPLPEGVAGLNVGAAGDVRFTTTFSLDGPLNNSGRVRLLSETLTIDAVNNQAGGVIEGAGNLIVETTIDNAGTISLTGPSSLIGDVTNTGMIRFGDAANLVFDSVDNQGTVEVLAGSSASFFGPVTGAGSYTGAGTVFFFDSFSPGNSPAVVEFAGDLSLESDAELLIELGGLGAGESDALEVAGDAVIDGDLIVSLLTGFTPSLGDTFNVVTAGTITGFFDNATLPGSGFELLYNPTMVQLVAVSALDGDYNNDGVVDAADYTVWRDNLDAPAGTLLNDPIDGEIGQAQYDVWVANFGATLSMAVSVPNR